MITFFTACGVDHHQEKELAYTDLVDRLMNMKSLAVLPKKGEKSAMWSSYDRDSKIDRAGNYIDWAANIDGLRPQYIRKEGENEVLAEMQGPGAIVRMWSASPKKGKVKIYIDDQEQPVIDESFIDYFKPSIPAFDFSELVYETNAKGFNNYVPITYNKSCKIVAEPGWGQYYQFNYITFPEGTKLEVFNPELADSHQKALSEVNSFFKQNMGESPYAEEGFKTTSKTVSLKPAEKKSVVLEGTGAIAELRIKIQHKTAKNFPELLRKTSISIKWDGSEESAVWSPLGDFFGTSPGWNEYQTLPMGMTKDWMYSYWYMPFEKGAELIFENEFQEPVNLQIEIKHEKLTDNIENYGRFHAKWHRDLKPLPKERWPDWRLLETEGRGRFLGTHLLVWNPKGGSCSLGGPGYYWWGEGDEKFFVDGETFPSTFGTGTEDYFGYAWCDPSEFERAFHSQTQDNDNMGYQPVNRWHIIDNIPFQQSFHGYLEKYFPNEWPTQYAAIVYWYLEPGGEDNLEEVAMNDRYGYEIPFEVFRKDSTRVVEGENMKIVSNSGGWGTTENFANEKLYNTVSGHKILLWFPQKDKENSLQAQFAWPQSGHYTIYANVVKTDKGGNFDLFLNQKKLGSLDLKSRDTLTTKKVLLGTINLKAGIQNLKIEANGEVVDHPQPIKLDYLEFEKK
ncbi:DUF2961 domain-containing protein [Zunongwangia pacifica]|uniref:DUF2961 domain-containing protein n=1 Tax=Zunongwangia pacifica TaxID=2911062 RepID=A0A9X1ZQ88_9FLAO|nr:DUF2961 domain-containing protein [Zunongwangia pacifica]MCL6218982.1 DUF2961 domain-containing protein [Zunongwangia pacifica]